MLTNLWWYFHTVNCTVVQAPYSIVYCFYLFFIPTMHLKVFFIFVLLSFYLLVYILVLPILYFINIRYTKFSLCGKIEIVCTRINSRNRLLCKNMCTKIIPGVLALSSFSMMYRLYIIKMQSQLIINSIYS